MKTYYKNPRTGIVTELDSENNTAVELVKIGELVAVSGEEEPPAEPKTISKPKPKHKKPFVVPGPNNSRPKINPPEIRREPRARYTPEEIEKVKRMWRNGDDVEVIAEACERKTAGVKAYIYALIVKGELQKRKKDKKPTFRAEGEMGVEDIGNEEELI